MEEKLKEIGLPADYELSPGEVDNVIYLTCKYTVGWGMRQADKAVVLALLEGGTKGSDCVHRLVQTTCEYLWDHIAGEPDDVTPAQLYEHMVEPLKEWFRTTDQATRSVTD